MSTNKTTNYNLHSWLPEDDFLRTEMNENFTKLDKALKELLICGSYTGDGAKTRTISLGFTPRAVFLITDDGDIAAGAYSYGGLALPGYPCEACSVVDGGFSVKDQSGSGYVIYSNGSAEKYYYLALR